MNNCVNIKAPAFKQMAKELNVSEAQLELLAHQYNMQKSQETGAEDASAFLADEGKQWVRQQLKGATVEVGPEASRLWEEQYSKPQVFTDRTKADEAFSAAQEFFKEGAVLKETNDGKYELTVAKPTGLSQDEFASRQDVVRRQGIQTVEDIFGKGLFEPNTSISIQDAIKALGKNKEITPIVALLEHLQSAHPEITIRRQERVLNNKGEEVDGLYKADTKTIFISDNTTKPVGQVLTHELLHPLLLDKLNANPEIRKELDRIREAAIEVLGDKAKEYYGLTNVEELISEVLTEGKLIKALDKIEGINDGRANGILQQIRNWFNKCLRLIFKDSPSLLDNTLFEIEQLISRNSEYTEEAYNTVERNILSRERDDASYLESELRTLQKDFPWLFRATEVSNFVVKGENGKFTVRPSYKKQYLLNNRVTANKKLRELHAGEFASEQIVDKVQEREERVRKFLADQQRFYNEIKAIQESGRLSSVEVRKVAADVAYAVSDLITQVQNGEIDINELVPGKTTNKPISEMSRAEILQFIGVYTPATETAEDSGAFSYVRRKYFGDMDTIKGEGAQLRANRKAAVTINENFRAVVELAAEEFVNVEGFGLRVVDGKPAEVVEGLNINVDDINNDDDAVAVLEREGNLQEHWQVNFRTIDVLGSMSQIVRQALLQCYKLDREGNPIESRFGIKERVTAREATSQILRWTQGAVDMKSMINKLKAKADSNPWINQIIARLEQGEKSPEEYGADSDFRSQFYNVFNKHFQLYTSVVRDRDGKFYSTPVNEHPALKDIMTQLQAFVAMDQVPMFQGGRIVAAEVANLKKLSDNLPGLTEQQFKEMTDEQIEDAQDTIWVAMKTLGLVFTEEQIKDSWSYENYKDVNSSLQHIVDTLTKHLQDETYDPFEFKGGIKGNLTKAISALIANLEDVAVSSFYDNGKTYQSYVTPSYLTKFMQKMRLQGEEFNTFVQDEFGQYNWFKQGENWLNSWLKDIVELGDRGFKCGNIPYRELFAHKVELNFNKHGYMREMTPAEYSLSLIAEYFSASQGTGKESVLPAWYRVPILSNKPSSEFIRFKRYADTSTYKELVVNDLMNVFAQELGRIKTTKARNLRYPKGSQEHMGNLDKNGSKFNFLPYLNNTKNAEFNELVERKTNPKAEALSVEDEARLNQMAREEIANYLTQRSQEILSKWEKNGVMEAATKLDGITNSNVRSQLENFIWNDHLATIMIEELFVTDIAQYKNTEDLQKRMAQIHAPGVRGDVAAVDYNGKRVSDGTYRTVLLTDFDNFKSNVIDNISEVFKKREQGLEGKDLAAAQALHESIIKSYKEVNVADAQGYSCITSRRKKDFIMGLWSKEKEAMYQRIVSNNYSDADLAAMFDLANACEPEKPFCYSQIKQSTNVPEGMANYKIGVQYKNSEYLLIMANAILENTSTSKPNLLRAINTFMEDSAKHFDGRGIDTVQFTSASKATTQGAIDINQFYNTVGGENLALRELQKAAYVDDDFSAYNTSVVKEVPFEDWCIQQPVPNHFYDHAQAQGSQGRMIIVSDLADTFNGEPVIYDIYGEKYKPAELREEYENTIARSIEQSMQDLSEELGLNTNDRKTRNVAIAEILQREIKSSPRYGTDLLRACTLDANGEFVIPLADPIQAKRIEQLLNSIIKNRVNKQEILGGPVVQVSNYGTSKELNIRFKAKSGGLLATKAEFAVEAKNKGLSPAAIDKAYADYCAKEQGGLAYYEVYASRFEGIEKYEDKFGNIDMARIEKECPELLDLVAYRIPTEDKYSMVPCKIVGFLPRFAGAGIMMPADITTQTGSDFDIDKMYIMRKQFLKDENGNYIFPHDKETTIGRNNRVVETYKAVLTHEANADKVLNPGGFEPQKMMGYMVQAYKNNNISWEDLQKIAKGTESIVGSDGNELTGINALKDLSYKSSDLGFVDTQIQFYEQNSAASSILAIFAVAKVAHATLEKNKFRVALDGTGPDGVGMRFPIQIGDFVLGQKGDMTAEVDPTFNVRNELIGKIMGSLVASSADAVKDPVLNLMNINKETVNILNTAVRLGMPFETAAMLLSQQVFTNVIQEYYKRRLSESVTLSDIINEHLDRFKGSGNADEIFMTDENMVQGLKSVSSDIHNYQVLFAIDKFMRIANALQGINFLTRFNSIANAVGPLIIDNIIKRGKLSGNSFSQILRTAENGEYLTDDIIEEVYKKHPILLHFSQTLDIAEDLFTDMPEYNINFMDSLAWSAGTPYNNFGKKILRNRDTLNQYADFFKSYMLVANEVIDAHELSYYVNDYAKDFLKVKKDEKYAYNALVQAIKVAKDKKGSFYLKVNSSVLNDQTYKGDLSAAWVDLLAKDKNLAINLFKYCFFRGGIGFTPRTFMQLVPLELKEAIPGYIETYRTSHIKDFPLETFARLFAQNNWGDNKLVPEKKLLDKNKDGGDKFIAHSGGVIEVFASLSSDPYVKAKDSEGVYHLYELQKYSTEDVSFYKELPLLGGEGDYIEFPTSDKYTPIQKVATTTESNTTVEENESVSDTSETVEGEGVVSIDSSTADYVSEFSHNKAEVEQAKLNKALDMLGIEHKVDNSITQGALEAVQKKVPEVTEADVEKTLKDKNPC